MTMAMMVTISLKLKKMFFDLFLEKYPKAGRNTQKTDYAVLLLLKNMEFIDFYTIVELRFIHQTEHF